MPPIKVNKFLGYSSKPDQILNPAVAADCENIIINKGDICNMPFAKDTYVDSAFMSEAIRVLAILYKKDKSTFLDENVVFLHNDLGELKYIRKFDISAELFVSAFGTALILFSNTVFYNGFQLVYPVVGERNYIPDGNLIQVGSWILCLSQFGEITNDRPLPYILRTRIIERGSGVGTATTTIGMRQPKGLAQAALSGGSINGTYQFAVSFITTYDHLTARTDDDTPSEGTLLGISDIESNVTASAAEATYTDNRVQLSIYLPDGHAGLIPSVPAGSVVGVGIYASQPSQGSYSLVKYMKELSPSWQSDNTGTFFNIILTDGIVQTETITAPTTGVGPILGAHDVPRPALHGAFYKKQMYYSTIAISKREVSQGDPEEISGGLGIKNRLQISPVAPQDDPNIDRYINYIEADDFVGDDNETITGLIELNGQLIIFKESETYVLTDTYLVGEIRVLFEDKGCVNVDGGKAYIVINNILYWAALDGIYSYDGVSLPVRISEPIQEELNAIDKERYSFARFGVDTRYNLLYVNFPPGHKGSLGPIRSFIYNYAEQVWTKTSITHRINDTLSRNKQIFLNKPTHLELLNLLDRDTIDGTGISWSWISSRLIAGRQEKIKHWKFLRIESETVDLVLSKIVRDGALKLALPGETIRSGGVAGVGQPTPVYPKVGILNVVDTSSELHVGMHTKSLSLILYQDFNGRAFRINGFELDAHVKGRR